MMAVPAAATAEAVWHALHDRLLRFIRARVEDDAGAEDILQEVFLKIHARIGSLRDEDRLEGWVWQITRNAIADYYRGRRQTVALPEMLPAPEAGEADVEEAARWLLPAVRATIDALPGPYREALLATEFDGLIQQELAIRAGISLSGAKSRVQRAREKLKVLLLACCHLEFDRRGALVLDQAQPLCACCAGGSCASIQRLTLSRIHPTLSSARSGECLRPLRFPRCTCALDLRAGKELDPAIIRRGLLSLATCARIACVRTRRLDLAPCLFLHSATDRPSVLGPTIFMRRFYPHRETGTLW